MIEFIGYPSELAEEDKMEALYKSLRMDESHFLEASLDLQRWSQDSAWHLLHEPIARTDWRIHGQILQVNANYNENHNTIGIPASILQFPFFDVNLPLYYNYALLGFIAGHEVTHGYDDVGQQFNAEGNLQNWWDKESTLMFNKKKQCIIDQYSSFNDSKHTFFKVNGIITQGENIADNGGLKLAHRAYQRVSRGVPQPLLPGLQQYTAEQLFYISYANAWCTVLNNLDREITIQINEHSPHEFRLTGTLQNYRPFSSTFQCRSGSRMNPVNKCEVW